MSSASWWNEKLAYNRWIDAEFNILRDFNDFKKAIDYSDDNLGEKEIRALLKQVLKRKDKILVERVINYIAENTPIGKRTLRQIIKELKLEALNKNSRKQNQETNQKSLFSGENLIPENYKKNVDLFLKSENKFKYIEEILDFNIVGEKNNKILLFILSSGSFFKIYQIIVIIGATSGGKSYIATEVLSLFPKNYIFSIFPVSHYFYLFLLIK